MKTHIIFLFFLSVIVLFYNNSSAQVSGCENHNCDDGDPAQSSYDAPLADFFGTIAYSNGSCTWSGSGCRQCVELVKRYYDRLGDIDWSGNADEWFATAEQRDLNSYDNNGSVPPTRGNVLCFEGGSYGHIGLVYSVDFDNREVVMIDQNRDRNNAFKTLTLTITEINNHKYYEVSSFGSYALQGWLSVKVGHRYDYSVTQTIVNKYDNLTSAVHFLGQPVDNGGTAYVHE